VFDEDRGWSWSQEENGNTGCNSDFIVEYPVEAAVTPSSTFSDPHDPSWYVSEYFKLYFKYF
jgi:hypothetical protein